MKIQSLSVVVPGGCPNKCKFCVANIHNDEYINQIENNFGFSDLYKNDFKRRLMFARDNGCNTAILTGNGEPLMNNVFLDKFGEWNRNIPSPFHWIELQTSGVLLNDRFLRFLRNTVGATTISLSLSDMFSNENNTEYNGIPEKLRFDIVELCREIKRYDFILRLSLNMTDVYDYREPKEIFDYAQNVLGADQVTFRRLYSSDKNTEEDKWIEEHSCQDTKLWEIDEYIINNGTPLEILPFGATRYSINGMSVVIDNNCMSEGIIKDTLKYLILRPNCHLYSRWDDKGSIIF